MTALLDLHPDAGHPVLSGVAEVHELLDRLHAAASPAGATQHALAEVERAIRRLESLKLKLVAAADKAGTAKDAGYSGTDAWVARHTTTSRSSAAREVALATELDTGHDATAAALDDGLLSPAHAAVIVQSSRQLPATLSEEQRRQVEAALVEKAKRFDPGQLRRVARRALEPDQRMVDAHENQLVKTEEEAARDKCSFTLHDNNDGTFTGHFTIPALAAGILGKVLEAMTAPRRMKQEGSFDWRHRRGLAFAELLEHLPTDHLHPRTAARPPRSWSASTTPS